MGRGFHHHATLCMAADGVPLSERGVLPPSGPRNPVLLEEYSLYGDLRLHLIALRYAQLCIDKQLYL